MDRSEKQFVVFLCLLFSFPAFGCRATAKSPAEDKASDYSKEPFVLERASTKVVFENNGTYSVETTARVHIQSQAGLQQFGLLNFLYPSATSTMEVVYVRVLKSHKRTVETPAENILDMPADVTRQAPFYSDLKEKQVAVKGLEIGDTLEYEYEQQVRTPLDPGQFWFSFNFFQAGIVLEEDLQISVPHDRYVKVQSPTLQPTTTEQGAYRIYNWKTTNLERKPEKKEPKALGPEEPALPSVQITTFRSWDDVGQWFRGLTSPRAAPTPEIRAKADELTHGAKTDSEKIQALYNYVSIRFRYIGISLGIGRYQPHAAADVLSNDYGDCKDKHTLFAALLAAEGIRTYPALILSTGKIDADVPSPSQFDHVMTAVPQAKGFLFLDTTPEVAPFGFLVAGLRDKQALVIPDVGPPQLVQTPSDLPFKSLFSFQAEGALDISGTLQSKMQISLRGDLELVYRAAFRHTPQPQWKDVAQLISSSLAFGGTVSDVTASAPEATDAPFHIGYSYERKEYSDWANKRISPPFPPFFLPDISTNAEKQSKPVKWGAPTDFLLQATVKLPENSDPHLPPSVDLHEDFADYHATYSLSDRVLHAERRLIMKVGEIAPGQIPAYRKFQKAIEGDEETLIPLFGGNSASGGTSENTEAQALFEQGREAWQQRNMPGALDAFQQAVDKDPKFAQAWLSLGAAHLALGDVNHGIEEMKKGIALDPKQAYGYKYLGSALMAMRRQQDALEIWREMEKAIPQDTEAPRNVAGILFSLKRYTEAVPELETAVNRNPDNGTLRLQLGGAYLYSGSKEKAFAAFQKALELDSTASTLNDVAYELADNNLRLEDALHYAEQAVKQEENATTTITLDALSLKDLETVPTLAAYWDTLGWVHFRMGHLDQAEKYLGSAWNLTQDAVIADHLGQVYEKQGKKHEAAQAGASMHCGVASCNPVSA